MVLVGNKVDVKDRKVRPKAIQFHRRKNLQYYDISAHSNYNIEKPFMYLSKKLQADYSLSVVLRNTLKQTELTITVEQDEMMKRELENSFSTIMHDYVCRPLSIYIIIFTYKYFLTFF
jgi:GTP-binding nuclear protein Ran